MPRQQERSSKRQTRARSKRLDQLDETKLSLALWLLAKQMLAEDNERTVVMSSKKDKAP